MMTVAERWQRIALIKEALDELSAHVPAIQHTKRELEQVARLRDQVEELVTGKVREFPASFNLVCNLLGVDPAMARRRIGVV